MGSNSSFAYSNLITTVTPIRNGGRFLPGLFHCLEHQTLKPAVTILSDNCSSDNTSDLLQPFSSLPGWKVLRQPQYLQAHYSWLAALHAAKTEYLMFLPCDDRLHPQNIESAERILQQNPAIDVLATQRLTCANLDSLDSHDWPHYPTLPTAVVLSPSHAMQLHLKSCFLFWPFTGLIVRTQLILDLLTSDQFPVFDGAGDIALTLSWINMNCVIAYRDEPLITAYLHPAQESERLKYLGLQDNIKILDYALTLTSIPPELHLRLCSYLMKGFLVNYALALQDPQQDTLCVQHVFSRSYYISLHRCFSRHGLPLLLRLFSRHLKMNLKWFFLLTPQGSSYYAFRLRHSS